MSFFRDACVSTLCTHLTTGYEQQAFACVENCTQFFKARAYLVFSHFYSSISQGADLVERIDALLVHNMSLCGASDRLVVLYTALSTLM